MEASLSFAQQFNSPVFQLLISNRWPYKITRHALLNFLLLFIFFFQYLDLPADAGTRVAVFRFVLNTLLYLLSASLVYLNIYLFVPRILFKGRLTFYLLVVALFALAYTCIILFLFPLLTPLLLGYPLPAEPLKWGNFVDLLIMPSIFLASTTGIQVQKKWIMDTIRLNALEKQRLEAELKQLRSQVNPHFLFNTLNNLHTLTKIDPDRASQVLLSLSDILRYQLYEGSRERVLLSRDVENIRQLLSLEKVRRDHFEYHIQMVGKMDGRLLPPFLFTPFVENAIKHSASAQEKTRIDLQFEVQSNHLVFTCINTKPLVAATKEVGGLGLQNIKRRLELLYPAAHQLDIQETGNSYSVTMIFPL